MQPFLYAVTSLLMFKERPQHRQVQVLSLERKGELAGTSALRATNAAVATGYVLGARVPAQVTAAGMAILSRPATNFMAPMKQAE